MNDVNALLPLLGPDELMYRIRDVRNGYDTGDVAVHALRSIDLDVRAGERLVMLGASGSGKSTLLNVLGALDVPTAGTVHCRDVDLGTADDRVPAVFLSDETLFGVLGKPRSALGSGRFHARRRAGCG